MRVERVFAWVLGLGLAGASAAAWAGNESNQLLYSTEGNRLRRYDLDTLDHPPLRQDILIQNATQGEAGPTGPTGRDVNGMVCALPDGRLVMGEDTGQPTIRPGFGVFTQGGVQVGKLSPTGFRPQPEPFGCAVDAQGRLFTTEIGDPFNASGNGQLILWFPPFDAFPGAPGTYPNTAYSTNYCKLDVGIPAASGVAADPGGDLLVASPRAGVVYRFSGSWPTGPDAAGGCGRVDSTGAPLVDAGRVTRQVFIQDVSVLTPSGVTRGPNGNWFVSSVLFSKIAEFDGTTGARVRTVMEPPGGSVSVLPAPTGHPQTLIFDAEGRLYYADLDLRGSLLDPDTGPNGTVRRITFAPDGTPGAPEVIRGGLAFPDGVAVLAGDLEPTEWRTLGRSTARPYFNADERALTSENVGGLVTRWSYPTNAIVTDSPSVANIDVPGEGRIPVVFFQEWEERVIALRLSDGSELWSTATDLQPGAPYPGAGSVHVERVDGTDRVFVGSGEWLYALDAATGQLLWRFTAGTGCGEAQGNPPGACSFQGERNQIESTPAVVDGTVVFGMDVDDKETGKGGIYGVDVHTGHLAWFFDLESGSTCTATAGDAITRFDGYHSAAELGLPPGFLAREGCDFDRTPTGCGNVWSSPAVDFGRSLFYIASSNCDTDDDPSSPRPPPPMPPYDEAIFAMRFDGTPAWRWRPREIDNDDLAFGAVPNLFSIEVGGVSREVLGIGGKDGTYYVLDRDGVNEVNGASWDGPDRANLPYWRTNVVPGGPIGGIIASAAVDEGARRVLFSTGPGENVYVPQRPTMHALDMDTGAVLWQGGTGTGMFFEDDASYGPTTGIPGVAFTGSVLVPQLRAWDSATGALRFAQVIASPALSNAITSGAAVVDGTVVVGTGIGTRTGNPQDIGDSISREPRAVVALCVPGTLGCEACDNGRDDDEDGFADFPEDPGCANADDTDELGPLACDDGLDNDGDGLTDVAEDKGCPYPHATYEDPQCDDGADNDGNGATDFADAKCTRNWPYWEQPPACGLGPELALLAPALAWLWSRRRGGSFHC